MDLDDFQKEVIELIKNDDSPYRKYSYAEVNNCLDELERMKIIRVIARTKGFDENINYTVEIC